MSMFKIGDRVKYTGAKSIAESGEPMTPCAVGWTGTITGNPGRSHGGLWDNGEKWAGYFLGNLELIETSQSEPAIDAHYTKLKIEPMTYSMENGLNPMQHTVIKYVTRFRDKHGKRDLIAARHVLDMMIEREYGE